MVLFYSDALSSNPNYRKLLGIVANEDAWAAIFFVVAALLLWRLFSCKPPRGLGIIAYAFLALFWVYLWWGLIMSSQPWPAGASSGTIVAALSLYAFISNPRDPEEPPPRGLGQCPITGQNCKRAAEHDKRGG